MAEGVGKREITLTTAIVFKGQERNTLLPHAHLQNSGVQHL